MTQCPSPMLQKGVHKAACGCLGVVPVAIFPVLLVVALVVGVVVFVVVVVALVLYKLCFDALSSPSETSAPDRVFKLRQSTVLDF